MLTELVREIRVYESARVEIVLNFQDELQALTEYLERSREPAAESR